MRRTTFTPAARRGFTLVELLVAAALCVIIMYVLATAFKAGTDTLSQLKSVASLAEQLRTADTIMRRDLAANHLQDSLGSPVSVSQLNGGVRSTPWNAPDRGYFRITQQAAAYIAEGFDSNGIVSKRTGTDLAKLDWLAFTCNLQTSSPLRQQETFFSFSPNGVQSDPSNEAGLDSSHGQQFVSPWGEVAYFLAWPVSQPKTPSDPNDPAMISQNLYALYRRARVVAKPGSVVSLDAATAASIPSAYPDMGGFVAADVSNGANVGRWLMNTPESLAKKPGSTPDPSGRIFDSVPGEIPTAFPSSSSHYGTDILLTNVLSMRVQVLINDNPEYTDIPGSPAATTYDTLTYTGSVRLRAVRVTLRIYDVKNKLTRQITIAQSLGN